MHLYCKEASITLFQNGIFMLFLGVCKGKYIYFALPPIIIIYFFI